MPEKPESSFWNSIKKNISKQRQQAPIKPIQAKRVFEKLFFIQLSF